ncbi:MAG TPA: ABC transporter substrate-binding protein [Chloroflexota bacterium]
MLKLSLALSAGILALSACGGGGAATSPASSPAARSEGATLQSLIDGARKEGALTFSYGGGTFGGNEGIQKLAAAFNKAYGLNVQVQVSPGEGMPAMVAKITQEYQAQKPASTDVVLSLADSMNVPIEAHSVQVPNWRSWAPNIQKIDNPDVLTPDGSAVVVQTFMSGISYNTRQVAKSEVPAVMADLLKPRFKGKIVSTVYATAFDWLASDSMWGYKATLDYVKKLSTQVAGVMRCGEDQRVATGEFDLFALDCSQSLTLELKSKGAPLDYTVPADAVLEEYVYAAVPQTAPHPNAAKLWTDFLVSPEAQQILRDVNFTDSNLLPGSLSGKLLQEASAGKSKVMVASVQNAKDHYLPNGPRYKDEFAQILLGK